VQAPSWLANAFEEARDYMPDTDDMADYCLGDPAANALATFMTSSYMDPMLAVLDKDAGRVTERLKQDGIMEEQKHSLRRTGMVRVAAWMGCEPDSLPPFPMLPIDPKDLFLLQEGVMDDEFPDLARRVLMNFVTALHQLSWRQDAIKDSMDRAESSDGLKETKEWKRKHPWSMDCDPSVWSLKQDSVITQLSPGQGVCTLSVCLRFIFFVR
jgi:hypothetical protein